MPRLNENKKKSRGESEFHYSKNIISCKWYDNQSVLLAKNVDDMSGLSDIMRQTKDSASKATVSCPNITKLWNNHKGGLDTMAQNTAVYRWRWRCKSKYHFYL